VAGAVVTVVAAGTCSITASQPGNGNYTAAAPLTNSFTVNQATQTIAFPSLNNVAFGVAPFTISATASSGLPVSFASTTPAVCTVSGATVTLASTGTCTIQATQGGNANYSAAAPVSSSFSVTSSMQTITFSAIANTVFGAAPFTISATASSGLPVSFASTTPGVCNVSGTTVTLAGAALPLSRRHRWATRPTRRPRPSTTASR